MPALNQTRLGRHRSYDWHVGTNIRYLRQLVDMEQKTLAELVDIDQSQLCRVEAGTRTLKFKEGLAIAQVFGVRPERLAREMTL